MSHSIQTQDHTSVIYECLSRWRRRYVLHRLHNAGQPLALADVAEDVAEMEVETQSELDDEFVKNVYMSLYHAHIPKLADADLVEYHQERDEVKLIEYPIELESMVESRAPLINQ